MLSEAIFGYQPVLNEIGESSCLKTEVRGKGMLSVKAKELQKLLHERVC